MPISARNQLNVIIDEVSAGVANSLVSARLVSGETLRAIIPVESEKSLALAAGKEAVFLFKASNVIIVKSNEPKLSATNQFVGKVAKIINGSVNSEIIIDVNGAMISAIITKESVEILDLKEGESVKAAIKATNIIVGVKA